MNKISKAKLASDVNYSHNFKKHYIKKLIEIALILFLFSFSATLAHASEINEKNITDLINLERSSRGLQELKCDDNLHTAAVKKSIDMIDRDYFEHYAFNLTPWDFISNEKYDYLYAGENLAMDFNTSEGMVDAWMSSPSHRKNILNPDYNDMCLGIVKGEFNDEDGSRITTMVTQMFGRKKPLALKIVDNIIRSIRSIL